jgi:DNA-binding transcriptional LysR family regulator
MQMRYLEYLDALAHARHFAHAAAACNVSQPGLSAGIRKLEADVGVQIVIPEGAGLCQYVIDQWFCWLSASG